MDFDFAVFDCEDLRLHTVTSLWCSTHSTSASPRPVWGQPVNTMDLLYYLQWLIPPHIGINLHIGSRYFEWWKEIVFTYFEAFFLFTFWLGEKRDAPFIRRGIGNGKHASYVVSMNSSIKNHWLWALRETSTIVSPCRASLRTSIPEQIEP
jgi:hypothetical protein